SNDSALVHASVLDSNFNPVTRDLGLLNPIVHTSITGRFDRQLTGNNTFTARYQTSKNDEANAGTGQFSLPSQAYDNHRFDQSIHLTDTQIFGPRVINETRFQYNRGRGDQSPQNAALVPTIQVPQAFTDGGNNHGIV